MSLNGPLFEDSEVSRWFDAELQLQLMLDVEVALAEAEAEAGMISGDHAGAIRDAARVELYSRDEIAAEAATAGNIAIPLVRALTSQVALCSEDAADHVHRGATSQDLIDTTLVLQLKRAAPVVLKSLERAAAAAVVLALRYADTPMLGRTWLQPATPITFGVKAAGWTDAIERARERIRNTLDHALVLQFGGATGMLASLGAHGGAVSAALGKRLGLAVPAMPWHTQRDRLADLACALAIACGTLGKIARDLALLAQGEVGEAMEAPEPGRGASSSMPQTQNPVASAVALSAATRAPGLVATMLAAMPQEHERGLGGWHAEWETLPELVRITGGAARAIAAALESLVVDVDRMRANLDATHGIASAEIAAAALTRHIGRSAAHTCVAKAARISADQGRPFLDVLAADEAVTAHLGYDDLAVLLSHDRQAQDARALVERVLAQWQRS